MGKRRRYTPEQIIRKLREAERLLGEGQQLPEVLKALEISESSYYRWRTQYGAMTADEAKRLKDLERENARLKRIVAEQALENQALKEIARGRMKVKWWGVVAGAVASSPSWSAGRRLLRPVLVGVRGGGAPLGCRGVIGLGWCDVAPRL
jgi:putative transposase